MRGTAAKRIRKRIYGDASLRAKRRYVTETVMKRVRRFWGIGHDGADEKGFKEETVKRGIIKNIGLRQQYQDAKKEYMADRRAT